MTEVRLILDHLRTALDSISRHYPGTADPPRVSVSHTRTAPGSKPPVPTQVTHVRREAAVTLTSWALLVAEERDLRPNLDTGDVPALAGFLHTHAVYLAGHEAGEEALRELASVAYQLEEIVRQSQPARIDIGRCPEDGCEGSLRATVRRTDSLLPSRIRCDTGHRDHEWEPHDWPALGRRLGGPLHTDAMRKFLERLAG